MTATVDGVSATAGDNGGGAGVWPVTGSNTVALPAGGGAPASGDLVLLPIFVRNGAQTIDTTATYTRLSGDNDTGTGVTAEIQAKVAGGSESAPTVTDSQTASQPTGAVALTIRGWSGILGEIVVPAPNIGGASTIPFPDATAAVGDCLVLRIGMQADDNTVVTPPAGHTQVFFELTAQGSDACLVIYRQDAPAAAGAVGTASVVMSGSDPYAAYTVVIPPSAGGPTPETGVIDAVLPALAGVLAAVPLATAAASAALPMLSGSLAGSALASGVLASNLPLPTAVLTAATADSATAQIAATLPALTGALSGTPNARGALSAAFPALIGALTAVVPGEGPTRAAMTAAVTARRDADSTTTARRNATSAAGARRSQTSGVT